MNHVVYSWNDDTGNIKDKRNSNKNMEIQKPYIRTEPAVWKRQDYLLHSKEPPQDIYKVLVEESGWWILSKFMPQEPKKIKQIYNRKTAFTEKLQVADAGSSVGISYCISKGC